jgi:RNA polymerase sigma-54 factor
MALYQGLHQKLQQKLSPQQIQLMKLLQVPTATLDERIKEEIDENPALELGKDENEAEPEQEPTESNEDFMGDESSSDEEQTADFSDYDDDGEIADYKLKDDLVPELQESGSIPHPTAVSLHEILLDQLRLLNLNHHQSTIAEQIIGSIDDDGYLRRETNSIVDDLAFKQNIESTEEEVEYLIASIQQFDPPGIAARDVREGLMIQLRRKLKIASSISQKNLPRGIMIKSSSHLSLQKINSKMPSPILKN